MGMQIEEAGKQRLAPGINPGIAGRDTDVRADLGDTAVLDEYGLDPGRCAGCVEHGRADDGDAAGLGRGRALGDHERGRRAGGEEAKKTLGHSKTPAGEGGRSGRPVRDQKFTPRLA